MQTTRAKHVTLVFAALALAGCASVRTPTPGDPMESFNRGVFSFNETVDKYALKPVAKGYQRAVPEPVRKGVTNFFSNIGDVYIAANELLQLKIADGVGDIMRVTINTLFGVGGLFDVASVAKLPKHDSDFGITLGHYGVPPGPYLVLPIFGPSTVRDAGALVVDYFGSPLTYISSTSVSWALYGVKLVNTRANLLTTLDVLSGAALDKYSFLRNAYLQRRRFLISGADGAPNYDQSLPHYDDGASGGTENAPAPGAGASRTAAPAAASGLAASAPTAGVTSPEAPAAAASDSAVPATSATPNGSAVPGRQ
ncbi:MAG: phospholipid-binding lipoprotein MlaA [Paraburkholderia sp.]|nr:phospholipid-binding lipoprotein MlaA [Paraburkholderia sp.]